MLITIQGQDLKSTSPAEGLSGISQLLLIHAGSTQKITSELLGTCQAPAYEILRRYLVGGHKW